VLFLPDSKTGRKTVSLNAPAMAILTLGVYVIAGDGAGAEDEKARSDLKRPWRAVSKHAKLAGVRLQVARILGTLIANQNSVYKKGATAEP
jgi:hypothetical protein